MAPLLKVVLRLVLTCAGVAAYVALPYLGIDPVDGYGLFAVWVAAGVVLGFGIGSAWSLLAAPIILIPPYLSGWELDDYEYVNESLGYYILLCPVSALSIGGGWLLREGMRRFASRFARPS